MTNLQSLVEEILTDIIRLKVVAPYNSEFYKKAEHIENLVKTLEQDVNNTLNKLADKI